MLRFRLFPSLPSLDTHTDRHVLAERPDHLDAPFSFLSFPACLQSPDPAIQRSPTPISCAPIRVSTIVSPKSKAKPIFSPSRLTYSADSRGNSRPSCLRAVSALRRCPFSHHLRLGFASRPPLHLATSRPHDHLTSRPRNPFSHDIQFQSLQHEEPPHSLFRRPRDRVPLSSRAMPTT